MIGKSFIASIKRDNSSCTMLGLRDTVRLAVSLDRGMLNVTRISSSDGEELRRKAHDIGTVPTGVPTFWWPGTEPDLIELWPMAAKDYTIVGEPR